MSRNLRRDLRGWLSRYPTTLPDDADRAFVEVALATGVPIITGNLRHFPAALGIDAVLPSEMVRRLGL